jgi:uncharacterized protein
MKIKFIQNHSKLSLKYTRIVLFFVLLLYIFWISAWILEQVLEDYIIWMTTSQGRFFYWLLMKLILWILPALLLIKYLGKDFKDIMGIKRLKSILIWGGRAGLILALLTIIAKITISHSILSVNISWSFIGGVITAPIVEEITFRGAILEGLKQRYHFIYTNLFTAVFFLGIHFPGWYFQGSLMTNLTTPIGGALSIFILGFIFGFVVYKSKSVSAGILAHFLNNLSNIL